MLHFQTGHTHPHFPPVFNTTVPLQVFSVLESLNLIGRLQIMFVVIIQTHLFSPCTFTATLVDYLYYKEWLEE